MSERMRRDGQTNFREKKEVAKKRYADRQIEQFVKWSWKAKGRVDFKDIVELQERYNIKVYGGKRRRKALDANSGFLPGYTTRN